jgi:hypothetical protein
MNMQLREEDLLTPVSIRQTKPPARKVPEVTFSPYFTDGTHDSVFSHALSRRSRRKAAAELIRQSGEPDGDYYGVLVLADRPSLQAGRLVYCPRDVQTIGVVEMTDQGRRLVFAAYRCARLLQVVRHHIYNDRNSHFDVVRFHLG